MKKQRILSGVLAIFMAALCAFPAAAEELPEQEETALEGLMAEEFTETLSEAEAILPAQEDEMAEDLSGEAVLAQEGGLSEAEAEGEQTQQISSEVPDEEISELLDEFSAETQEAAAAQAQEDQLVSDTGDEDRTVTFEEIAFDPEEAFSLYAESILYDEDPEELLAGGETASLPADYGSVTGYYLSGNEKALYNYLKPQLKKIAEGSVTSTIIKVPITVFGLQAGVKYSPSDFNTTYLDKTSICDYLNAKKECDVSAVITALLYDSPYELYWYDKVSGTNFQTNVNFTYSNDGSWVTLNTEYFEYRFYVNDSYDTSESFVISTANLSTVRTAVSNAAAIVSKYAGSSDYQKIAGYFNEIKSRVTYDYDAADSSSYYYGDPWQIISVFDNDSSTNVVCEGYSKAFQYLCDKTAFNSSNVVSICVDGVMTSDGSGGNHMWNIIRMNDGNRYLVDVTNCDDDSVGSADLLFLKAPVYGSVSAGYTFRAGNNTVTYTYSSDALESYPEAWLTLRSSDYTVTADRLATPKITSVAASGGGLKVSWGAVAQAAGYLVYRSTSGGSFVKIAEVAGSATSYTDAAASKNGVTYSYEIKAVNSSTSSYFSKAVSFTHLSRPTIKQVSNVSGGVQVTWYKNSSASGYIVYRSTNGSSFTRIAEIKSNATVSYTDTGAKKNGQTYYYRVYAYKTLSGKSCVSVPSYQGKTEYLPRPTIKSVSSTVGALVVTWYKNSSADGYYIYRSTDGKNFTRIADISGCGIVSYKDTGASVNGKKYYYRVYAYAVGYVYSGGSYTQKIYSSVPSFMGKAYYLHRVTISAASKATYGNILLWTDNKAADGYLIYRSVNGSAYEKVGRTGNTSYYDTVSTSSGRIYRYRIYAYKEISSDSLSVSAPSAIYTLIE